ncbi:hypothetical protein [Streptomyces sp. NPDC057686]|uniref:hypothetical protein n=1 Tax=Streptomyces sp. NPDC057686 TaxID=3346212 RepID=UPI0036BEA842
MTYDMHAWSAKPTEALWFGEVAYERPDGRGDYQCGYSAEIDPPDVEDTMVPVGCRLIDCTLRAVGDIYFEDDGCRDGE